MKKNVGYRGVCLLSVVIGLLSVTAGWAAEEAVRPYFVWSAVESIQPEHMGTYMKGRIADAKLSAEHKFEFPFVTFVSGFEVHTAGIFQAFAQLDGFPEKMEAWDKKTGGKGKQLQQQCSKCVSGRTSWISVFRPDLTYEPENPVFTPDFSKPFYRLAVIYSIKPGKHDAAQEVAQKIKALHEKRQSPLGYRVYERICGEGVPAFVVVMSAKDKAQFVKLDEQMKANPDPEIAKFMEENAHVLAGVETKEATFVPQASYVPEGSL